MARYWAAMTAADSPRAQDTYRDLSELLLGVLAGGRDPGEVGRAAGRLIAEAARGSHPGAPDDALAGLMWFLESRGFMPEMVTGRPGIEFRLGCCPFAEAALVNPALVCGLHRAVAEGVLEALGGHFEVTRLVARHPLTAGCRLELRAARPGTTEPGCRTCDASADRGGRRRA
jgi:predicted ArsR family transcriptional regulator